jgi:Tfp pilus assembly PilM family ATPase
MSRLVSIECDSNEVRIAVGSSGLTGLTLEHVVSGPLSLAPNEDPLNSPKTLEAVQTLLKGIGVKSGNVVFCVGRGTIELRSLTLPTTDKNELPDMVRFAALRQFANVGDHWPIDFVVLPSQQENMTDCLAASINPATVERLSRVTESLGLTLTHIVLRPMASAMLAALKQPQLANSTVLLVEMFRDEADMAVLDQGHVVFMRNVRFSHPTDSPANLQTLQGEIKRTIIAAASQRTDLKVEHVRIWGSQSHRSDMCATLTASLGQPVESIDPFDLLDASKAVRLEAANGSEAILGKFASSIGGLIATQASDRIIDFSNPRKKVEAKSPLVRYALAGTAAAVLLGCGYGWHWMKHSALDSEISQLNGELAKNVDSLKIASKKLSDWKKVESFLEGDHSWLDELEYLSAHASTGEKAIFGVTTFVTDTRSNSAMISTKFLTKEQEDVPDLQAAFRDANHTVRGNKVGSSPDKSGAFPVAADLNIKLGAAKVTDPRRTPKAKAAEPRTTPPEPRTTPPEPSTTPLEPSTTPLEPSSVPSPPSEGTPPTVADSTSPLLQPAPSPPPTVPLEPAATPEPSTVPEPTRTEPTVPAEPTPAEPVPTEPVPAEPTPAEPTPAEPTPAEPTPAEPAPAEPTPAEPAPAEPAPTGGAK